MKKLFALFALLSLSLFPTPAQAFIFPTGSILKDHQFSLESHGIAGAPSGLMLRGAVGFDSLELGLSYFQGFPAPLYAGPSGDLRYQVVIPSWPRPTAVATGLLFLGLPSNSYGLSNNAFLTLSQDLNARLNGKALTLATAHFGFMGDLALRSRLLAGLDLPLGERGDLNFDYLGAQEGAPALLNVGVRYQPIEPISLFFMSLAIPGQTWWERSWQIGIRYLGTIPQANQGGH